MNMFGFFIWSSKRLHFHMYFPQNNHFLKAKKITLVSESAGDEKNLHPGCRKFIFFNPFSGDFFFRL